MLAVLLSEGSAMDWSSLHAQQHLGVSASQGALALGSFVVAMTVSRFIMNRVAQAVGAVWVLRAGAVLAIACIR
jgi:fucose permease